MTPSLLRTAAVLGLLSAVGPFAIDLYLPALPLIEASLDGDVADTQMTLSVYFFAFGVAQLFYGPLADQVGRKRPLYIGLSVFLIGSIGCALAPSISMLVLSRFIQGLGAAAVMVIPRAIVRDLYTGTEATRLMALIMLVISVSPMLAPLAGSGLIALGDWRLLFWVLAGVTLLSLWTTHSLLPETLAVSARIPFRWQSFRRGSGRLFRDPFFMALTFVGGFGMASFFVFLASASFVYTGQFGLDSVQFSLAFALNAVGFFATSQLAATLGERFGMVSVVVRAVVGFAVFACALLLLAIAGLAPLWVIIALLFCANACLGLVIPSAMVMSLDAHGDIAGLASSLGGTLQMVCGGLMIAVTSPFFDGTALPMIAAISACALAALGLTVLVVSRQRSGAHAIDH